MSTVIEMPKLSDTMKQGSVARWLKKEGEKVTVGTSLVEIETDKATMEYEASASGVLLKILVGDGQNCALQDPIAVVGKSDEKWEEILEKYNAKKGLSGTSASEKGHNPKTAPPSNASAPAPVGSSSNKDLVQKDNSVSNKLVLIQELPSAMCGQTVKASPLAKKIAADKGLDLKTIQGSGPGGRIIQRDLENMSSISLASANATVEKIAHTNMRKTIARRLTESTSTTPHFYVTKSLPMTSLLAWRKEALSRLPEDQKFSVNDLVLFLTSRALKRHPNINSSWQEEYVAQYRDVHVCVAVALPNGLVTPVIRHCDQFNVVQIAQETRRLVKIAREGKLQPADYSGGTFSISNLGMVGVEEFTAIINPPQAAILAVGACLPIPVVLSNGLVGVEQRMKVTLSCDHRVIDGAQAAEFLNTLKQFFEDPISALFLG